MSNSSKIFLPLCFVFTFLLYACENGNTPPQGEGSLKIRMLDVGQGLSVLLETEGKFALFDTGPDSVNVEETILAQGARELEWIAISHMHRDHAGGFLEFGNSRGKIEFKKLYLSKDHYDSFVKDSVLKLAALRGMEPCFVARGNTIELGNEKFQVLWPPADEELSENGASMVLSLRHGKESLLLTGDLEKEQEERLLEMGNTTRGYILQVGHHGSTTSSSLKFLESVAPRYAMISAGIGNPYGHPTETTLQKLYYVTGDSLGVLRTDTQGSICLEWQFNIGVWPCD